LKRTLLLPVMLTVLLAALLSSAFAFFQEDRTYQVYLPQMAAAFFSPDADSNPAGTGNVPSIHSTYPALVSAKSALAQGFALTSEAPAPPVSEALPPQPDHALDLPEITDERPAPPAEFVARVVNGQSGLLVGVFVDGKVLLPVIQQPHGQAGYVSNRDGVITQFAPAVHYGTMGLLAHNFLSGSHFFDLETGDQVVLIFGDGALRYYHITSSERFQALNPLSTYSEFIDQSDPSQQRISSTEVFKKIYTAPERVVFQTCIEANGNASWGRLFVIGEAILD
jgi:hypothetical protein